MKPGTLEVANGQIFELMQNGEQSGDSGRHDVSAVGRNCTGCAGLASQALRRRAGQASGRTCREREAQRLTKWASLN